MANYCRAGIKSLRGREVQTGCKQGGGIQTVYKEGAGIAYTRRRRAECTYTRRRRTECIRRWQTECIHKGGGRQSVYKDMTDKMEEAE